MAEHYNISLCAPSLSMPHVVRNSLNASCIISADIPTTKPVIYNVPVVELMLAGTRSKKLEYQCRFSDARASVMVMFCPFKGYSFLLQHITDNIYL